MNSTAESLPGKFAVEKPRGLTAHLKMHLELGRVSNLPTVWSNVFCGAVVASSVNTQAMNSVALIVVCIMFAMSTFYVAGMYLNDACDAQIDGLERPSRPIPSGRIKKHSVLAFTAGWFCLGWFALLYLYYGYSTNLKTGLFALAAAAALSACIVLYDLFHKNNPLSPVIMGLCRVLVVVTSFTLILSVSNNFGSYTEQSTLYSSVFVVCTLILSYLAGLTFIAKYENQQSIKAAWPIAALGIPVFYGLYLSIQSTTTLLPTVMLAVAVALAVGYVRGKVRGGIPKAIGMLIAGISLIDAIVMSAHGSSGGMIFGISAFFLTLLLQRRIAGT